MELYVYYGEEDFLREYNANKTAEAVNLTNPQMNLIKLTDETIDKLPDNCEQLPFFDEKKVIMIRNSGLFTSGKKVSAGTIEKVSNYLENAPDYAVIIFNEDNVDKRLTIYKKLSKIGKFEEVKYRELPDLTDWVCRGIKKCGAEIDTDAARYLAESCGPSMSYLYTEIQKLAALYQNGEKINKELIDNVCMKSMQGIIFDLTDAIGMKNKKRALELTDELILKKEAEQFIVIMLYKHFRNMFLVKSAMEEGLASAEYLGINPYVYRKLLGQVKNYSVKELYNILDKFAELDYKSKKSEIDLRIGLDIILSTDVI